MLVRVEKAFISSWEHGRGSGKLATDQRGIQQTLIDGFEQAQMVGNRRRFHMIEWTRSPGMAKVESMVIGMRRSR